MEDAAGTAGQLSVETLKECSAIFRSLSEPFLRRLVPRFKTRRFEHGEAVCFAEGLLLLRSGRALLEDDDSEERPLRPGAVLGEARLLGLDAPENDSAGGVAGGGGASSSAAAPHVGGCGGGGAAAHAEGLVVASVLRRRDFEALLGQNEEEAHALKHLRPEVLPAFVRSLSAAGPRWRHSVLQGSPVFRETSRAFLDLLAAHAEDVFLAPGEALPAQASHPALYVVVSGPVHIEGENAALLRVVNAGDSVGEAQAMDLAGVPPPTHAARAGYGRTAYVLRLSREALLAALHLHPEEHLPMEEFVLELEARRAERAEERYDWISNQAAPVLGRSPLLAGCPDAFLSTVAGHASEVSFVPGGTITTAGEPSTNMFVVLEGSVELQSRSGAPVGRLTRGGSMGEVEALGIFGTATVTAVAASDCRVLKVSREAFERSLKGPAGKAIKPGFDALIVSRHEQVAKGLPFCGLKISASPTDISVRTVSLQSERMPLEAGEVWRPLPDSDPSGPRVGILLRGRAVVELVASGREVMPLTAGAIVNEGLLAEFGARVRAVSSDCEAYRVRTVDLLAASQSEPKAPAWFYEFRLLEREASDRLRSRLGNARSLVDNKALHPCDPCIRDWTVRRQQSIRRAQENRLARADVIGEGKGSVPQLPLLPPDKLGTTAFRSWDKVKVAPPIYPSTFKKKDILPKGLRSYPCMRLPKIHSEPNLRSKEARRASSASASARSAGSRDQGSELGAQTWEIR